MTQKDYFKQLREELHGHPLRGRFLEELQNHSEDLEVEKLSKEKWENRMGQPKEINEAFRNILDPWSQAWSVFLYGFSMIGLFITWKFILTQILIPWEGAQSIYTPALISLSPIMNDFAENELLANILNYLLLILSGLIVILKVKKGGIHSFQRILNQNAILNWFYIGILLALFLMNPLLPFERSEFSLTKSIFHFLTVITLFYLQWSKVGQKKSFKS